MGVDRLVFRDTAVGRTLPRSRPARHQVPENVIKMDGRQGAVHRIEVSMASGRSRTGMQPDRLRRIEDIADN